MGMDHNAQGTGRVPAPMVGVAFLAGIGTGALIALLVAPKRGFEMRAHLLRKFAEVQQRMGGNKGKMKLGEAGESVEEALTRVQQALKRERLSSAEKEG